MLLKRLRLLWLKTPFPESQQTDLNLDWTSWMHISITSFMTLKTTNKNLMTLDEFKEKNYGKRGTTTKYSRIANPPNLSSDMRFANMADS